MATGDIDDILASAAGLALIRQHNPELDAYLTEAYHFTPIRTFFIPYGAGISSNGKRVYISYDLQTTIDGVECANALVRHECTEWGLRYFLGIGTDYASDPRGHRLGNRAEHDRVVELLDRPDAWDLYAEVIDPQVILAEREDFEDKPIPQDLALYPYPKDLRYKLRKAAMENQRSWEEWEKVNGTD